MTSKKRNKNKTTFYNGSKMLKSIIKNNHPRDKNQAPIICGVRKAQHSGLGTGRLINQKNQKTTTENLRQFYSKSMIMLNK